MMTLIVILMYFFVFLFDFLPLIKNKKKNELWAYSITLIISFSVLLLFTFDVVIPSPSKLIQNIVETLFHIK